MTYEKSIEHFSLVWFLIVNISTLAVIFASLKLFVYPVWVAQLESSWLLLVLTFCVAHFVNAFIEYFFHRYVLHAQVIPFFAHFYQAHNLHHNLTNVKQLVVTTNKFPIMSEPQHESSFFPWWSLLIFSIFLTPLYTIIWYFNPSLPIFIGGYTSLFVSMLLYELFHQAWHWPLSSWKPLFSRKYTGRF